MAKKIKLNIKDCMPRMVVAETVYNDFGAVMVWQNTILNELTISQLDNLGVDYLYIYEQEINVQII